jgi:quercetin dioxygenase-like cupin family protein
VWLHAPDDTPVFLAGAENAVAGMWPEEYASAFHREPVRPLIQESKEANMSTAPKPQSVSADPVHVDSKHYTVDAENDRVRVIRARYGPREKSVMHGHPPLVAVFLTSNSGRFTFPDGRTEERSWKAGESMVMPAENHLPENLSDNPLEVVLIELK